ncbi:hypothetical protein MWU75_10625 [Ornithinimicrobium sp. F0845]|uniref:hypothetical protein n=1 Tax=Ornithinimicrobium sp. F0845 TaxID=2926412 RepID=UPI001FF25E7A|nr:hypothetical protein [Ornithinimicrobium sp. F0845]MCK0112594.1 hypothetical protein [Ornithinimicrobium sp. F0845]
MTPGEAPAAGAEQPAVGEGQPAAAAPLAADPGGDGSATRRPPRVAGEATSRARTWVTATPYRLPLAVAMVGLVLSAPFGGWRPAESGAVPVTAADEVVEAAPFEITLERAYFSPRPSESFPALDPGQQYVVVLGTLTSRHDATVDATYLTRAVAIEDLPEPIDLLGNPVEVADARPELYSAQDSTSVLRVGPDLTYDIGLVYRTAADELPEELTLALSGYTWRPDAFTGEHDWRDPAVVSEVVVPLARQEQP